MIVEQLLITGAGEKAFLKNSNLSAKAQMVLVFGAKQFIFDNTIFDDLRNLYPNAYIMGCSTAGEIFNQQVTDNTLTATAIYFEKTTVKFASIDILDCRECYRQAAALAGMVPHEGLKHVFLLAEGIHVNGSKLVAGLRDHLPKDITITGGLSGDGDRFKETYVIANQYATKHRVSLAAFYGNHIKIGYASAGGWDSFGMERLVTRSSDNILYELDGKPVLDLYKEYLGEYCKSLPLSAFYFPLSIRSKNNKYNMVRTILGLNEAERSLVFAGDIPEGHYVKLMKANTNNLLNGARKAAESCAGFHQRPPKLAILISCVGRKLILKQMTDDEVEVARGILGEESIFTGFYSYGEIAHIQKGASCELHNQTMTITTFDEGEHGN
jgi:hypothetical protein